MDEVLRYYIQKGFSYKNVLFLSKYHNTEMSMRSLQQRLHDMGLAKKYFLQPTGNRRRNSKEFEWAGMFRRISFALACPQVERYSSTTTSGRGALP